MSKKSSTQGWTNAQKREAMNIIHCKLDDALQMYFRAQLEINSHLRGADSSEAKHYHKAFIKEARVVATVQEMKQLHAIAEKLFKRMPIKAKKLDECRKMCEDWMDRIRASIGAQKEQATIKIMFGTDEQSLLDLMPDMEKMKKEIQEFKKEMFKKIDKEIA